MTAYLFSSHDGYGLGHTRRNTLIAARLLELDPTAEVTVVTGLGVRTTWSVNERLSIVSVPPLVKDHDGAYRHATMPFEQAIAERARVFADTVVRLAPDVVVVDRHPFGIGDELRRGLQLARDRGAAIVLGLRDILDEPTRIADEIAGSGWRGMTELYDHAVVYGGPQLCDHLAEYGLPIEPTYCGWVTEHVARAERDDNLVVISAGGGGDGADVFRLGIDVLDRLAQRHGAVLAGPYAVGAPGGRAAGSVGDVMRRIELVHDAPGCASWFARAGAVMLMAGYNSTFEALGAGLRPVLVPRRNPRREQAIRATRLAALGLADVVDVGAAADEVAWLLQRPRYLAEGELEAAGIRLDGADRAATMFAELAASRRVAPAMAGGGR